MLTVLSTALQEGVFVNLRQLKSLSLSGNVITSVEPTVFDESANLSSLSTIDLSHNFITELEPWPFVRARHRPTTVSLRNNRITNFTNTLRWILNCNSLMHYQRISLDLTYNDIKHIADIIDGWNIDGMTSRCCCCC